MNACRSRWFLSTSRVSAVSFFAQGGNLASAEAWAFHGLVHVDLAGALLSGCGLSGIALFTANLNNATLIGTHFSGANLGSINAVDVIFTYANFSGADIGSDHLVGADFDGADLTGVNLLQAELRYADLTGATIHSGYSYSATYASTICPDGTNSDVEHWKVRAKDISFRRG